MKLFASTFKENGTPGNSSTAHVSIRTGFITRRVAAESNPDAAASAAAVLYFYMYMCKSVHAHVYICIYIFTYMFGYIRISIHTAASAGTNSHKVRELLDSQQRMTMNDPDLREFVCRLALLQGVVRFLETSRVYLKAS